MYPQYRLPPINPAAFGGLPPQQGPQGGPPMDMNKYLMNKVAEIRERMGAGDMGALSAIADAMPQPQMNVAAQPPQPQPQPQQRMG